MLVRKDWADASISGLLVQGVSRGAETIEPLPTGKLPARMSGMVDEVIGQIIRDLQIQKQTLEQAIIILEALPRPRYGLYAAVEAVKKDACGPISNPRGRRSMPSTERKEVSERMKRYWNKGRQQPSN